MPTSTLATTINSFLAQNINLATFWVLVAYTVVTMLLAITSFVSNRKTTKIIKQTKDIADAQRKDNFMPVLDVEYVQIYYQNTAAPNFLIVRISNTGKGSVKFMGFEIKDTGVSGGDQSDLSHQHQGGLKIEAQDNRDVHLPIFSGGKAPSDFHEKRMKLFFADVFGRKITLYCTLFIEQEKAEIQLHTKPTTTRMSLP